MGSSAGIFPRRSAQQIQGALDERRGEPYAGNPHVRSKRGRWPCALHGGLGSTPLYGNRGLEAPKHQPCLCHARFSPVGPTWSRGAAPSGSFLIRPDRETNNAFIYCLAVAAHRYRIRVLFTVAMSNHHHTGVHDPEGNYPPSSSTSTSSSPSARTLSAVVGRTSGPLNRASVVRLVDPDDVIAKMTYAITNSVKDHVVEKAHHCRGLPHWTRWCTVGR